MCIGEGYKRVEEENRERTRRTINTSSWNHTPERGEKWRVYRVFTGPVWKVSNLRNPDGDWGQDQRTSI